MVLKIRTVSVTGQETLTDVKPADNLIAMLKSYRQPQNRMVCLLQDGIQKHRWDRTLFTEQKNHWCKVHPFHTEIIGSVHWAIQHIKVSRER